MNERTLKNVSGWQYLRASSIFKNVSNKNHDGSLEVLSATQDKGIIPRSQVEIDIKYDPKSLTGYKKVEKGNFVISLRSFQGGIEYSEYEGIVSPAYTVLSAIMPISRGYYRQFFKSALYVRCLRVAVYGIRDGKQIGYADFGAIKVPYPPLEEQRRIGEILTTQDKIIALKERRLAEKRRQKTFLAQRLLTGKTRLPGFDGEWKTERLGALFAERVETKREDLELLAITASQGVIPRSRLDLKDNSSEDKSKYLRVCVGDIGYNTMRMWQGVSAYSNYEGIVSPAYTVLKPSADVCAKYFAYLFKTPKIVFLFYRHSQGLVDDTRNLKYANFKKISVVYPPNLEEQQAIAEVLTCADREIEALQRDLELEKRKKKALMQLLLTGVVRVNSRRRSA